MVESVLIALESAQGVVHYYLKTIIISVDIMHAVARVVAGNEAILIKRCVLSDIYGLKHQVLSFKLTRYPYMSFKQQMIIFPQITHPTDKYVSFSNCTI